MRILIATDAWHPQVNGVVRTLSTVAREIEPLGASISFLTPDRFPTIALPIYREIRLAIARPKAVAALIAEARVDAIHIATEGPIGHAVRGFCCERGIPFTTSFHTRFPEYVSARVPIPESWTWSWLRRFHAPATTVLAATPTLAGELAGRGFRSVAIWPRGVDTGLFRPRPDARLDLPRPIFLTVGRVAPRCFAEYCAQAGLQRRGTRVAELSHTVAT